MTSPRSLRAPSPVGATLLVLSAGLLPTGGAAAHGREPIVGALAFDGATRSHIVVRTTWAILESHDDGASFVWRCAAAIGYRTDTEDPPIAVASSGETFAGTFDGIVHGGPDGCAWSLVADPDGVGQYAIDLDADPTDPRTLWAALSPGATPNRVIRSTDDGASWDVVGTPSGLDPIFLAERLALAPSDPMRVYVSGAVPSVPRRAYLYRSEDGGDTFVEREVPLEGEERNVHVLGVDPTNADRVFVRMTRRVTDEVPERLLVSDDGGDTWAVAASLLEITGFAISGDGMHAWVGGWDGAFLRSDAGGAPGTFVPVSTAPDLRVRCLSWRSATATEPGELWVCLDDIVGPFALARSTDLGQTLDPVWGFEDATPDTGCPRCTPVGLVCPEYWGDVVFDLGLPLDAGVGPDATVTSRPDGSLPLECIDGAVLEMDGGTASDGGVALARGGCACRTTRSTSHPGRALWACAIGLMSAALRRRARSRRARA